MTLHADLYEPAGGGETKPAIVASHEEGRDRSVWMPIAKEFTDRGFTFLAVDLRGHGKSRMQGGEDLAPRVEARDAELFAVMANDVRAAVDYVRGTVLADG